MTVEIALVLCILGGSLLLFVTEWVRMDLTALMVLSSLAVLGLISPAEAVSGFSNAAVITVLAMFILSEGLTRSGIADIISRNVARVAGRSEVRMIAVFMLVSGVLSAFMNNIGVATLMLPVAVEVARAAGIAPSRVLMPLAYGTLLGGMTTLIGTPPNLLVSMTMVDAGMAGFGFFDFAWIGLPVLLVGTAFVALIGRHLLPETDTTTTQAGQRDLRQQYSLQERIFALRVPPDSVFVGKTLADTALPTSANLVIIAVTRHGHTEALPDRKKVLQAGDVLLAQGRLDRFEMLRRWNSLAIEREAPILLDKLWEKSAMAEVVIDEDATLIGENLRHRQFREQHAANVLAIRRGSTVRRTRLSNMPLAAGDRLLLQCAEDNLEQLGTSKEFSAVSKLTPTDLDETYQLDERLFVLRVPKDSALAGTTLAENRLGDAFDFRLLGIFHEGALKEWPGSDEVVEASDLLLIQGREEDLDVLRGLQQLEILDDAAPYLDVFNLGQLELVEATLHPRVRLQGRTVADLKLRERYEVEVAALWRDGESRRSALGSMPLAAGDALLIVGPKRRLAQLNDDEDLIILNPVHAKPVDSSKAPLAGALMLAMVAVAMAGWLPISVAALVAATLMVLTRCLTMDQAYGAIEWRTIFVIAGMIPLGIAMQQSGAATFLAGGVTGLLGPFGPWAVIAGLYAVTTVGTLMIPAAALVLIMAPLALSLAVELGVSPAAPLMAVAIAVCASLSSPVSHPANILVMGPGGYKFVDYLKLGLPLQIVVFAVAAVLLPIVWPL
ncbi:MAG: SLC13 family permease [Gammaproteobacteria bacterium]|nr:SLC13 family permease [Gammaproteobacteria bacterium]